MRHILALPFVLLAAPVAAQPVVLQPGTQRLAFDHSGAGVTRWEQQTTADAPWVAVEAEPASPGVWRVPFLPMTDGTHAVRMRACYTAGVCSDPSEALAVTLLVITAPRNLRIEATP